MRAYIVTQAEARRLPLALILLLGVLYLIPGLLFRDPWGGADGEGLGVALTMATGGLIDWLAPNIFGLEFAREGPLGGWIGALGILTLGSMIGEQAGARLATGATVAFGLYWIWLATARLASRPEVQPSDPFEASASPTAIGRAVADAALLVTMASCGLIARVHETTPMALQFSWTAAWLLGAATAIDRPVKGGLIAGAALAASALTRGLPTGGALLLALLLLPLCAQRFRIVARPMLASAIAAAALLILPWPILLMQHAGPEGAGWLDAWLGWNVSELGLASERTLTFLIRNIPWYLWPTWPLALWAAWQWRRRWATPALALPLLLAAVSALQTLLTPLPSEAAVQPAVIACAVLAALGLPTVRRPLVSLLDWTAVATFSLIGFAIWAYWFALHSGFPPRMADSAARLAPGFVTGSLWPQTIAGLAASAGWLTLVWWRTSRRPRVIWRPMVLSCGGLVLSWFLLITLWLPMYDARMSYRKLATDIAAVLGPAHDCVRAEPVEPALRASLAYFGGIRFARGEQSCGWLLSRGDNPGATPIGRDARWLPVWQGRRAFDATEQLTLFRRAP